MGAMVIVAASRARRAGGRLARSKRQYLSLHIYIFEREEYEESEEHMRYVTRNFRTCRDNIVLLRDKGNEITLSRAFAYYRGYKKI